MHFIIGVLHGLKLGYQSLLSLKIPGKSCTFSINLSLITNPYLFSFFMLSINFGFISGNKIPLSLFIIDFRLIILFTHWNLTCTIHKIRTWLMHITLLIWRWHHSLPWNIWRDTPLNRFEFRLGKGRPDWIKRWSCALIPKWLGSCFIRIHVRILSCIVRLECISIHQLKRFKLYYLTIHNYTYNQTILNYIILWNPFNYTFTSTSKY